MEFQLKGPITAQRAEAATEWLVHNAALIAQLKGNRDRAEYMVKRAEALAFELATGSAEARRQAAKGSDRYLEAVEEHVQAIVAHEEAMGLRKAAETLVEVFRSLNANLRRAP
ncbi:hypothetical protein [Ruegeria jejuensis]|uniref:hypothetical protein n=1 Tax=Ruegeria jejuensis TaxID=3233338 RepID=UPI00355B6047